MELRLARGRLRVHLLLIPVCAILICTSGTGAFFAFGAALLLHELAHLFMASALGVQILSLELLPFGCAANMGGMEYTAKGKEVVIAAAGPAASLLAAAACRAFDMERVFLEEFFRANLALGAINLMPVFPLDGGRIGVVLLGLFLPRKIARGTASVLGILLGLGLCGAGIFLNGGLSCWVMGGFMVMSSLKGFCTRELNTMTGAVLKQKAFFKKNSMDVRTVAVSGEKTLGQVYVSLDQRRYNIVCVVDGSMQVREILDEGLLMRRLMEEGSSAPLQKQKESEQKLLRFPK